MTAKIEQALHEKLCAYVLGELEGVERAELERELLRSPELRAEKERVERTIGVVKDALGPAEVLPPAAHEALTRAVRPTRIAQFPWMRMAAGIGAIGLGWWMFTDFGYAPADCEDLQIAHATRADEFTKNRGSDDLRAARVAGRDGPAGTPADPSAVAEKSSTETAEVERAELAQSLEIVDALRKLETLTAAEGDVPQLALFSDGSTPPPMEVGALMRVDVVDRYGQAPSPKQADAGYVVSDKERGEAKSGDAFFVNDPHPSLGFPVGTPPAESGAPWAGAGGGGGGNAVPSTGLPAASAPSSREKLKGRPSGPAGGGPSSPAPATSPAPTAGGSYRGPGDSVAAGAEPVRLVLDEEAGKKVELEARLRIVGSLGYTDGTASDDDASFRFQREKRWGELTPHEQQQYLDWRCGTIVRDCFRRPNERPRDMFFRFWGDNPFEVAALDRLSTFSIDVDTASYALARRYLSEGNVPEKAQVRTEEFVNYFGSDVPAPSRGNFAVHTDLTPSRFSADAARQMLRVVVRARDVQKQERMPLRLTFVVDVSGSMREQNRLETVKHALRTLVAQLDARDAIALVRFSTDASLVLPMTPVVDRAAIEAAIDPLVPDGSTNSNAGLQLGYAQALAGLDREAMNRVVFLSDGVANVGEVDPAKMIEGVRSIREKGIFLNTIGVGMNNHNDVLLEQLADKGDGMCNYVDSPKEIQRALVDRFTGAFQPVGRDVKIQVEFDPDQVLRYRLLGYENRAVADADFRNDAVDAGEIGAGHQVTALYELEPTGRGGEKPLATVRVRWKPVRAAGTTPGADEATEAAFEVSGKSYQAYESSPPGHRRALIVAQFAEILRRSIHARGDSLDDLIREADVLQKQMPEDREFAEFTALLLRSKELILRRVPACDELCQTIDHLRSTCYLGATAEEAGRDARTLAEIEKTTRELEMRVRELLRRQLEAK